MKYLPAEAYERYDLGDRATPADFIEARYQGGTRASWRSPAMGTGFAVCDFVGERLAEIRIHPIDLGHKRPRTQRGRPVPAKGEMADRILNRIQRLSAKYGTKVEITTGSASLKCPDRIEAAGLCAPRKRHQPID